MANHDTKHPLLSTLVDPAPQPSRKNSAKRRYRRCKSAPTAFVLPEKNAGTSISIFTNLHPSFKQVALFLVFYLGVGTFCFYLVRDEIQGKKTNGVLDAVYFCIVTMTTVGYGDLVPDSIATKLLACAFVLAGMALVGLILSKAADYIVEKQEILFVKALHFRKKVGGTDILREIETNEVKYKLYMILAFLLVLIVVGTIVLTVVENLDLIDAFYCVCTTITTLGYGDKSFSSAVGRVFSVFWILTSTICLAQFFLYLAQLNTQSRQQSLVKLVLTRKLTYKDLEAADFDGDGVVSAAEFIIYKLKEMGKINQEDIALVMEEFEDLDVDQSGTLSASDIMLAQSSQTGT